MTIATGLPVSAAYEQWRLDGENYTEAALRRVADIKITDKTSGRRSSGEGRFRPSMIGNSCQRAQVLSYLGFDQAPSKPEYVEMANVGSALHYWWQEMGLSAGWLSDVEVEIDIPEWRLRGQADGQMSDGSVWELKTLGSDKFWGKRAGLPVMKWEHPVGEHVRQVHAYMHALGTTYASIVYVDRDSNAYREFRVPFDQDLFEQMDYTVKTMIGHIDSSSLPPILEGCQKFMDELNSTDPFARSMPVAKGAGAQKFNFCNYREVCGGAG